MSIITRRRLATLLLSGSVLGLVGGIAVMPAATGCAATLPATVVLQDVTDGLSVLSLIETAVANYIEAHTSTSPAVKISIANALQKAHIALVVGEQALAGVTAVTQGQLTAAFSDFASAYASLMSLVAPLGIVPAQPAAPAVDGGLAASPATVMVPLPLVLRARGAR